MHIKNPQLKDIFFKINELSFDQLVYKISNLGLTLAAGFNFKSSLGIEIFRARKIELAKDKINHVNQLLYNPWPKGFDRASTPCHPMFYGSFGGNENQHPLITNVAEINQVLRKQSSNLQKNTIALASFELNDDITASALIFNAAFLEKNPQYLNLYHKIKTASSSDFELLEDFSNLFAASENDLFHDYRLTAAITHHFFYNNETIEAIIYPSVRLSGEGTNIAIHPITAITKLICTKVAIVNLYIKNQVVVPDFIKESNKINPDGTFKLNDCDFRGEENCKKILDSIIDGDSSYNYTHKAK